MNTEPIIHPVTCLRCGDSGIVQRHPFIEPCDCPAGAERAKPQPTTQTDLWLLLHNQYGLILLESEEQDIRRLAATDKQAEIDDLRAQLARMQAERDESRQYNNKTIAELQHIYAERDGTCAYAGRLREALTEQLQAQKDFDNAAAERGGIDNHGMQPVNREYKEAAMKRFRAAVERLSAAEEESAAALPAPDALAAQQAEAARLRDALAELSAATIDSRCTCHDEPEGDMCEYCLRRRDAHEVADGLCFYKHP